MRGVAFAEGMKLKDLRNDHLELMWALYPVTYVSMRARHRSMGGGERGERAMRGWKQSQRGGVISAGWPGVSRAGVGHECALT